MKKVRKIEITTMTFQLPVSLKKRLKSAANKHGKTLRQIINEALSKVK
jgi:predicted DNA-binding protein